MKKILILFILFNLVWVTLLGSLIFLAEAHPLRPGHSWYRLQQQAEQWRLELTASPARQTDVALNLVERRLADLAEANEPCCMNVAISAFDQALNEAVLRIDPASMTGKDIYYGRFKHLLLQSEVIFAGLEGSGQEGPAAEAIATITRKIIALQLAGSQAEMAALVPVEISFVQAAAIPFLAQDMDHGLYPLAGGHAPLECVDCHPAGEYSDTPTECQGCHTASLDNLYALLLYPDHFAGACADCHRDESWMPYQFNHLGIMECQSCHTKDTPTGHYPGACLVCHTDVVNWEQAAYVHANISECRSCHLADTPRRHYVHPDALVASVGLLGSALPQQTPTTCFNCHPNSSDWTDVIFDHAGFDDCAACHQQNDRPDNHYRGQCANCHTIASWDKARFNHDGFSICQKCHLPQEQDHYLDDCSTCHTLKSWQSVDFSHTGDDACAGCHYSQAPTDHYAGQCLNCHSSESWTEVSFNHTEFNDCQDCHHEPYHYPGQCSNCHLTAGWHQYQFDHTGFSDCKECHSRADHELGQCSKCHNVERWEDIDFDHNDLSDCIDCHSDDAPSGHFSDQCSLCHNTDRWDDPEIDHDSGDDCQACHTPPPEHWSGQCSICHYTDDWTEIDIDHAYFNDCQECHAAPSAHWPGQCSTCHNTDNWSEVDFDHSNVDNCESCHTAPSGHYSSYNCETCHISTEDWNNVNFNHTTYTKCRSCHMDIIPDDHPQRQCAQCHTTDTWDVPE